jgi:hypothetical protein
MNKKQTTTTLALVGMAILTTVMTTTINHVTPASALGHSKSLTDWPTSVDFQ